MRKILFLILLVFIGCEESNRLSSFRSSKEETIVITSNNQNGGITAGKVTLTKAGRIPFKGE